MYWRFTFVKCGRDRMWPDIRRLVLYTNSKISGCDIRCRAPFRPDPELKLEPDSKKRPDICTTGTGCSVHLFS